MEKTGDKFGKVLKELIEVYNEREEAKEVAEDKAEDAGGITERKIRFEQVLEQLVARREEAGDAS